MHPVTLLVIAMLIMAVGPDSHQVVARPPTVEEALPSLAGLLQEIGLAGYGEEGECPPDHSCCSAGGLLASCHKECYVPEEGSCQAVGLVLVGVCECVPPIVGR